MLDLGERPFVPRWGKLAIQRLERCLLRLGLGEPGLKQRKLGLRLAQALLRVLERRVCRPLARFDIADALGGLESKLALGVARVDP